LKNATLLREKYNTSINEVWVEGVRLNHPQPFGFVKCLTINPPVQLLLKNQTATVNYYILVNRGGSAGRVDATRGSKHRGLEHAHEKRK
jgi:ribosomal protein S9